ncbi:TonB protein C-terminal [Algoriphagus faecimaris]|uniref:TonB protein C-terminal n=1 Tax=Algoriphagus faecimaris TaxID=686796 RepID=A0A1G6RUB5_9BACT|nr:energy transducer TonB [Algoriphagus faecimaris]SDD08222.1 TonB protein C-terminal [Algoriphagus faecimaris]
MKALFINLFAVCFLFSTHSLFAQDQLAFTEYSEASIVSMMSASQPAFEGGHDALIKFMTENFHYPSQAKVKGHEGTVIVEFLIEKSGKISQPVIKKSVCETLDKEALKLINKMPDWIPAAQNGMPMKTKYQLPIRFELN